MSAITIMPPFPIFNDTNGVPLQSGYVYVGVSGMNAEANPIQVFWDSALTIPALQPLRTSGGYISRNGSPAQVYADAVDFSLLVKNKSLALVWSSLKSSGIGSDSSGVVYFPAGTGAVPSTVESKLRESISVKDFGAKGDGATDDTVAIAAAAAALLDNQTLVFPSGVYLVSSTGATNENVYGKKVMFLSGKKDIHIKGESATIKCVNHNITANGGLMFLWVEPSQRVKVSGLRFDMTFTGVNNSGTRYPFCGAIILVDTANGTNSYNTLNNDIAVSDCSFKLFHPYGQFASTTAGNSYLGDSNNGYKLFSVFASGDNLGLTRATQNSGLTIENLTFEDGHNGYGIWPLAWNDVSIDGVIAKSWVGKNSSNGGSFAGGGLPLIRYSQYQHNGLTVTNCRMYAKPCNERTAGFEGSASFVYIVNANVGNFSHGNYLITGNRVIFGNGDLANSVFDEGITNASYGHMVVANNFFDGIATATNANGDGAYVTSTQSGTGYATLTVTDNTIGALSSYMNGIRVVNGASTSANDRKLKSLIVTGNTCSSQLQYFLDTNAGGSNTHEGVAYTQIENNTVIGTFNTVFNKTSTNSFAYRLSATEATDVLKLRNNITVDKYYNVINALPRGVNAAASVISDSNSVVGVNTPYTGGVFNDYQTVTGSFNPILKGATTAGSPVYVYTPVGRFIRIGNFCYFNASIQISSAGGAAGNWEFDLNDIPFVSKNTSANLLYPMSCFFDALSAGAGKQVGMAILPGTKKSLIYSQDPAGGGTGAIGVAGDSSFQMIVSGFYEIA
jgi:hypothetical protein